MYVVLANVGFLLLIEGLSSGLVVAGLARDLFRPLGERVHTRHDADLGWTSIPNLALEDMYGPGIGLHTNAQGFRHTGDVTIAVPPGRSRVICSGDSFAFGPGVSNEDTWCQWLQRLDPGIEAVNMGQLGYGFDQAWLWYERDGAALRQDVHLFTFIADDFERMRLRSVLSYGKPVLAVEGGELVRRNVPVPYRSWLSVRLGNLAWLVSRFRTAELIRGALSGGPGPPAADPSGSSGTDTLHPVVTRIFDALETTHAARGSAVALVFLPVRQDYDGTASEAWRTFVRDAARDRLTVIDLVGDFRALPADRIDELFIGPGETRSPTAAGHYSARGHEFVARTLHRRMMELPLVRDRLTGTGPGSVR